MGKVEAARKHGVRFKFFSDTIAELKKVIWPTRREAIRLTIIVLIVCIGMGIILGVLDYGFTHLVWNVLLGR
jgi:preprotein translocase subunit SecE